MMDLTDRAGEVNVWLRMAGSPDASSAEAVPDANSEKMESPRKCGVS
jgi:hypothetical protein